MSENLDAALKYATAGFLVFPIFGMRDGTCACGEFDCDSPAKHPCTDHGLSEATTEEQTIRRWWHRWPDANVGIRTGPESRIYVIDIDVKKADGFATLASLEDQFGPLPDTLTAATGGGGQHLVFRYPDGDRLGNTNGSTPKGLGAGIDTRGAGGYIVAAPSVHKSGGVYSWQKRLRPAPLPEAYVNRLRELAKEGTNGVHKPLPQAAVPRGATSPYGRAALERACRDVAATLEGGRRDTLNIECLKLGHLIGGGEIDEGEAKNSLFNAALLCGLGQREAAKTINEGIADGKLEPESAPSLDVHGGNGHIVDAEPAADAPPPAKVWPELTPIDEYPLPEFPFEALPYEIREWVRDTSVALQVPPDLPAMLALAVLAATCAGKFEVSVRRGWTEPLNLYSIVALEPGSRKSAAFASATRTIYAYQEERQEEEKTERRKESDLHKAAEQRVVEARKTIALAKTEDQTKKAAEEYEAALQALKDTPKPKAPFKLVGDDVTPERVVGILSEQRGRFALFSAEGGLLKTVVGTRYSKNATPSYDALLKAHAGDPITHDRQQTDSVHVQRPALTLGLCVQPTILKSLASEPSAQGVGLLARFLYSVPKNTVGAREIRARAVDSMVEGSYQAIVRKLLEQPEEKIVVPFTSPADDRMAEFEATLEPRLADDGDLAQVVEWASKLAGTTARIAALLHITESHCPGGGTLGSVSLSQFERALQIGEYLLAHARAALLTAAQPEETVVALRVLRWIGRKNLTDFTFRDCYLALRSGRGTVTKAEDLEPALTLLRKSGYIDVDDSKKKRVDSLHLVVNPACKICT